MHTRPSAVYRTHVMVCVMCVIPVQAEIKAYLEAVYGMQVERVQTINYLGKLHKIAVKVRQALVMSPTMA